MKLKLLITGILLSSCMGIISCNSNENLHIVISNYSPFYKEAEFEISIGKGNRLLSQTISNDLTNRKWHQFKFYRNLVKGDSVFVKVNEDFLVHGILKSDDENYVVIQLSNISPFIEYAKEYDDSLQVVTYDKQEAEKFDYFNYE